MWRGRPWRPKNKHWAVALPADFVGKPSSAYHSLWQTLETSLNHWGCDGIVVMLKAKIRMRLVDQATLSLNNFCATLLRRNICAPRIDYPLLDEHLNDPLPPLLHHRDHEAICWETSWLGPGLVGFAGSEYKSIVTSFSSRTCCLWRGLP